jgi:ascorbate-specific PTS system EIIC-type component UlaA
VVHRARRAALGVFTIVELVVLLTALAKPAYGYVDPGSGLLAIQVGGSMLAGALFILRSKIRKLFRMGAAETKPESEKNLPSQAGE